MKLVFIGSGSAFTVGDDNYNSNMLLINEDTDAKLLIDCGSDARHALFALGFTYQDITDVYISHLHADHSGGLEWLALTTKFDPRCKKPRIFANQIIIQDMWEKALSAGLGTLQAEKATLSSFFDSHGVSSNGEFTWDGVSFQTVQMVHVMNGYVLMPSFGLIFTINGARILITTDTQFGPPQLFDLYKTVDVIFHDCETNSHHSGVHAHFDQLSTLDPIIKAKMWLYHYNPGPLPDAQANGFRGFVKRGQIFKF